MNLSERLRRFAPVELTAGPDRLTEKQKQLVRHLIEASRSIDEIYQRQLWSGTPALRDRLAASHDEKDRQRLRLLELMKSPWDRFDAHAPFAGAPPRRPGVEFYPPDMAQEEFDRWLEEHPEDRKAFTGYFTVIRRQGESLAAVPYHQTHSEWLEQASEEITSAARLADHPPLAEYLDLRAQALLDDDYYDSDCAWVALQEGAIETVIGPYEVYDDQLFGYKASYKALVGLRDREESARFQSLVDTLPTLSAHLPVEEAYREEVRGLASPIVVADTVYNAGQVAAVAIPVAFVLPNDPRVRNTVGTKKVMVRNICQAKFDKILYPIAQRILDPEQASAISFDDDFAHILLHEISHALGVRHARRPDGSRPTLNEALRNLYSPIEECKADIVGLYNLLFLCREGVFPRHWREVAPATYLARILRITRFGVGGSHSQANLLAFNYLLEKEAIRRDRSSGRFRVEPDRVAQAVEELSRILLTIEGRGDYQGAQALIDRYARVHEEIEQAWESVREVPVDLSPSYPWAEGLDTS